MKNGCGRISVLLTLLAVCLFLNSCNLGSTRSLEEYPNLKDKSLLLKQNEPAPLDGYWLSPDFYDYLLRCRDYCQQQNVDLY